jgi:hypothetical protein
MKKKTRLSLGELITFHLKFDTIELYQGSCFESAIAFFRDYNKYYNRQLVISHV